MIIRILQQNESLQDIADEYQVTIESLKKINHIKYENILMPGVKIKIIKNYESIL